MPCGKTGYSAICGYKSFHSRHNHHYTEELQEPFRKLQSDHPRVFRQPSTLMARRPARLNKTHLQP